LWPDGPICPRCGQLDRSTKLKGKSTRIGVYKCRDCRKPYTVKVGAIFEDSHIPLRMWLQAIALLCASKKGINSNQLHRMLGITIKSAWFMSHRIREAMRADGLMPPLGGAGGVVEIDETIYGRAATHPKGRRRKDAMLTNSAHKNVILALVERGGSVRSYHVAGSTVRQVIPIVQENVSREAAVMTDKAQLYKYRLGDFASHARVDHGKGEYVRYEEGRAVIHTNAVENYFSVFKRGHAGHLPALQRKAPPSLPRGVRPSPQPPQGPWDRRRATRPAHLERRQGQEAHLPNNSWSATIRSTNRAGIAAVLSGRRSLNCFPARTWVGAVSPSSWPPPSWCFCGLRISGP